MSLSDRATQFTQRAKSLLFRRRYYRDTLCGSDGKLHPSAQLMLADLMRFSKYNDPSIVNGPNGVDVNATMFTLGMQALLKRMLQHAHMDDSDLIAADKALRQAQSNLNHNPGYPS